MKIKLIIAFLICAGFSVFSQTIEEDIRTMLEISKSADTAQLVMSYMIEQDKTVLPEVPAEYWDSFAEEFEMNSFIDLLIPIYKKYYTQKDIQGIIEFYKSPVGRKMIEVQPNLTQDSMIAGQEWGALIGERLNMKLKNDGYLDI